MNINLTKYRDVIYIIIILVVGSLWLKQCDKSKEYSESLINLNDSISVLIHKDGTKTFTTGVVETDAKTFKKIKSDDPGIIALQKAIDNRTESATFMSTSTKLEGTFKDSTYINTAWMKGFISRTQPDSIKLDIDVQSDYVVEIREKGIFKPRLEVDVYSFNPNSDIGVLKTYMKPSKRYNIVIGPQIGVGYSLAANRLDYYVGIGATYPLIKL